MHKKLFPFVFKLPKIQLQFFLVLVFPWSRLLALLPGLFSPPSWYSTTPPKFIESKGNFFWSVELTPKNKFLFWFFVLIVQRNYVCFWQVQRNFICFQWILVVGYYTLGGVLKEITFVCDKVEEIFKIVPKAWVLGGGDWKFQGEIVWVKKKAYTVSLFLRHALKPGCETRACKQFAFFSYWPKKVWKSRGGES